jgi:hypothetical protein
MTNKVFSYGVVGLLAVALVAGVGYILLNPTEAQSQGPTDGQGRGRSEIVQNSAGTANGITAYGQGQPGQGRGRGNEGAAAQGQGAFGGESFGGAGASDGRGQGQGQGRNETVRIVEWETLTGKVTAVDGDVTIQTAEGQVLIGMGQSAYREGFELEVGDEITVVGFHEDGDFKAGSVENLTTGETIVLRDETGRPMWAGRGRLKNQDS